CSRKLGLATIGRACRLPARRAQKMRSIFSLVLPNLFGSYVRVFRRRPFHFWVFRFGLNWGLSELPLGLVGLGQGDGKDAVEVTLSSLLVKAWCDLDQLRINQSLDTRGDGLLVEAATIPDGPLAREDILGSVEAKRPEGEVDHDIGWSQLSLVTQGVEDLQVQLD